MVRLSTYGGLVVLSHTTEPVGPVGQVVIVLVTLAIGGLIALVGVAVMADAVSGADQRGLPAGHFHLPPAVYTDDLEAAERSLERLAEFEFDAGLVFHGSSVLSGADEKLEAYVYRG